MRVTLISPYPEIQAFGIRILSSCLKREGHDVHLIFLQRSFTNRYNNEILSELIKMSKDAELIGISLMTNFFDNVVQITQGIKKELNIPVLWGGIHPTIRPEECLSYADMVCIGEGEETIVELAKKIENGQDYSALQGLWLKHNGKVIRNRIRALIQDLDSVPFQDYDYKTHYILDDKGICKMNDSLLRKYTYGTYLTIPTRGCFYGCSYCCNNTLNKMYSHQQIRKRRIDNIIKELAQIKISGHFEYIKFDDDNFFSYSIDEIREFSEKYKKNIDLPLTILGITPSLLTEEKLSFLVDAGLTMVRLGIQTASERTKNIYKRFHSNQKMEEAVKVINKFKDKIARPFYDIILDNPWESEEDLIETLMFLAKLPSPYELVLYSLTFYPETELYRMAKRDGFITDDLNDVYRKYYYNCRKTYLNRLFFLLNDYAKGGSRISPKIMSLLVNPKLRQLKLNWLLYIILRIGAIPFKLLWFRYLLQEGLKDILSRRDWSRIIWYFKRKQWHKEMSSEKIETSNKR